nr:DUF1351 domain-containing protein [uncultured Trichococcus sp.]
MSNELEIIQESTLGTIYEPATLEMHKFEEMKQLVQGLADKYKGLAFTRADKKGAEEVRSKLLEVIAKFEKERKIIKKAYNEPLIAYESDLKELKSLIEVPLNEIRDGLKEIEEAEREERVEALNKVLGIKLEGIGIEIVTPANWLNKTMWTSKLNPSTKLNEEIDKAIADAVKEKKTREMQVDILTEFCNAQDIDPAGWVSQLDHRNAMEVIELINMDKERKARLAAEQEKRAAEHEAMLAKKAEELAAIKEAEFVEVPKLEPANPPAEETALPEIEPIVTTLIRVSGTMAQMVSLKNFIAANGIKTEAVDIPLDIEEPVHVGFEEPEPGYMEDDFDWAYADELPF